LNPLKTLEVCSNINSCNIAKSSAGNNNSFISMANPVLLQKFYKSTDPGIAEQICRGIQ
jgi:hypothetical protein